MRGSVPKICVQLCGIVVTVWFFSQMLYVMDEGYRSALRTMWKVQHGPLDYNQVLTNERMEEIHAGKKRDYLEGHGAARKSLRPWKSIEEGLEGSLLNMFERTDKMKAWELKKIGNAAWHEAFQELKYATKDSEISPAIRDGRGSDRGVDMSNVLVYNRIPKSGSTLMLWLMYAMGRSLGSLVLRGQYHSYRQD